MQRDVSVTHAGIVLFYTPNKRDDVRAAVLDINELMDTRLTIVRFIYNSAFKLPRNSENWEESEKEKQKKKLARMESVLSKSEMITFEVFPPPHKGEISEFTKIRPFIISRIDNNNQMQIKLMGIINPTEPSWFYSDDSWRVIIPHELRSQVVPNVYVWAWIELKLDMNYHLECTLHSFDSIADLAAQQSIGTTPWNRENVKYVVEQFGEEDDNERNKRNKLPDLELTNALAYMTGERSFLLKSHPHFKCILPIKRSESWLNIGQLYTVDCIWNVYEKIYMVNSIFQIKSDEKLSVDPNLKELRCNVKAHESILGLYSNETFGHFSDFHGVLSLLHLTSLKLNSIQITFTDPGPSRSGQIRYSISRIIGDKQAKFEKILAEQEIAVSKARGIVIDYNAAYSAQHNLIFTFDKKDIPPRPGRRITFDAKYNHQTKQFMITSWSESGGEQVKNEQKRMIKSKPLEQQCIFQTTAKAVPERGLNKILFSDDFGLLEDNLEFFNLDEIYQQKKYDIWVKKAGLEEHSSFEPRTRFHIIGIGKEGPVDIVAGQPLNDKEMQLRQQFMAIVTGNQLHEEARAPRFSRPGEEPSRPNMEKNKQTAPIQPKKKVETSKPLNESRSSDDSEEETVTPMRVSTLSTSLFGYQPTVKNESTTVFEGAYGQAKNPPLQINSRFSSKTPAAGTVQQPGNSALTHQHMGSYLSRGEKFDDNLSDYQIADEREDVSTSSLSNSNRNRMQISISDDARAKPSSSRSTSFNPNQRVSDFPYDVSQYQEIKSSTQVQETKNQQGSSRFSTPAKASISSRSTPIQEPWSQPENSQASSQNGFQQEQFNSYPNQDNHQQGLNYDQEPDDRGYGYYQKGVFYPYPNLSNDDRSRNNSSVSSINEAREFPMHQRCKQEVKPYTGVVLAPSGLFKYDIAETLTRLKHQFPISTKKEQYITEISRLIMEEIGFWDEALLRYPKIAASLYETISLNDD